MSKQFSNWTDQEDVKRTDGEGMKNDEIDSSSLGCWSVDFGKSRISKEAVESELIIFQACWLDQRRLIAE